MTFLKFNSIGNFMAKVGSLMRAGSGNPQQLLTAENAVLYQSFLKKCLIVRLIFHQLISGQFMKNSIQTACRFGQRIGFAGISVNLNAIIYRPYGNCNKSYNHYFNWP
jgi:hypothetical protein